MTAAWVAGSVRARAMARRRYGAAAARSLAAGPSLADALNTLSDTPYRRDVHPGQSLAEAQHALGDTVLWHLRVLAGWMPRQGTDAIRLLAAIFEIANTDELLRSLHGATAGPPPYRMGSLATAWPRLAAATSPAQIRDVLRGSPWGDPGAESLRAIQTGMRLSWCARLATVLQTTAAWASGAAALLVAREAGPAGYRLADPLRHLAGVLIGPEAADASSYTDLVANLSPAAAWVLPDGGDPTGLWSAEAGWWRRVEQDGFALLHRGRFDAAPLIGAAAVLAADAWRVRAALEIAARGGMPLEVFDAVA